MDTSNCSVGLATDVSFPRPFAEQGRHDCELLVSSFLVPMLTLLLLRSGLTFHVWISWSKRRQRMITENKVGPNAANIRINAAKRLPIVPLLSSIILVLWTLFAVCLATNISNTSNGISTIFLSWTFTIWAIFTLMFVQKLVKLGNKMVPWSPSRQSAQFAGLDQTGLNSLFDSKLQALFILQTLVILSQLVIANIMCPLYPNDRRWYQMVVALAGSFIFAIDFSVIYQLERLVRFLAGADTNDFVKEAIRRLRTQQIYFFGLGVAVVSTVFIVASDLVYLGVFTAIYWSTIELCSSAFAAYSASRRRSKRERRTNGPNAANVVEVADIQVRN
jgi:hypothetical protein